MALAVLKDAIKYDNTFGYYRIGSAENLLGHILIEHMDFNQNIIDEAISYFEDSCNNEVLESCFQLSKLLLTNENNLNINKAASITAKKIILNKEWNFALEIQEIAENNGHKSFSNLVDNYIENSQSDLILTMSLGIAISSSEYENENIPDIPQAKNDAIEVNRIFNEFGVLNFITDYEDVIYNAKTNDLRRISQMFNYLDESASSLFENQINNPETNVYFDLNLVFYFSGHGISYKGENYLIPVDFPENINNFEEARPYLISFNKIVESWTKVNPNGQNVFILDACRTVSNSTTTSSNFSLMTKDGFLSFNNSEISGLVQTQLGSNTMIVYATSPGKPSYYNEKDENSIFTQSLINAFDQNPAKSFQDIMLTVQKDVKERTKSQQIPWVETSLSKKFYLQ